MSCGKRLSLHQNGDSGLVFIKENLTVEGEYSISKMDHAVYRSKKHFEIIFKAAGYDIIYSSSGDENDVDHSNEGDYAYFNELQMWVL